VPLRDELSFVQAYLEIEQTRFSDRLAVRFDVDPATLEARIPTMALQPLVENAIRHGIARDPSAGRVEVRALRSNGSLRVEVANDGPDAGITRERPEGVGLANTRARLSRLYGASARLELESVVGRGTVAVLEVPWQADRAAR
jgi:two-component system LytT family sensor kinase